MNHTTKNIITQVKPDQAIWFKEEVFSDLIRQPPLFYFILKRCLDVVVAFLGIIVLFPLFILLAISIKINDGGPILHFREIIGFHGRCFYAIKFRTMMVDADLYLHHRPSLLKEFQRDMKLERDPRITFVGRFLRKMSLDELPQLINVLLGQMSLVGPRMIHPSELSRYGIYAKKRLSVRPGITGLWQVSSRKRTSYEERVKIDMKYIDERNILLDASILLKTFKVFFVQNGI